MASEHGSRSSPHMFSKKHGSNNENNGHLPLAHRLSRAEYDELRSNGTANGGSSKISEPSSVIEGASGTVYISTQTSYEKPD